MAHNKSCQRGFAHLGVVLLVLVAGVIGFTAYMVQKSGSKGHNPTVPASRQTVIIQDSSDLGHAENLLNQQNLDNDLNPAAFDQAVSDLN